MPRLSIVIPCFNEAAVLDETIRRLSAQLTHLIDAGLVSADSSLHFVDDGSTDGTWEMIRTTSARLSHVHGIRLSRNRGHQNALIAGLMTVPGDLVVSIDADLQDDPAAIEAMVRAAAAGADIVYGVRRRRDRDTLAKRLSARAYYLSLGALGVNIVYDHADFRLLSRRALDALAQYEESNLFLRGIIPQLGFNSAVVHYDRAERFAGESKYPLRKMISFAFQGVTSFSAAPLRAITIFGFGVAVLSLSGGAWVLWNKLWNARLVPGWASTVLPVFFLGGVQMISLGVIGEYVAKLYIESKARPRYFIESEC